MGVRVRRSVRLALAVLVSLVACTSKPAAPSTPGPGGSLHAPSAGASSPDPRSEVQAAVAAYLNLLNAYVAASNSGTTDTTGLARYATGSALQVLSSGLSDNKANGVRSQGTPGIDPPHVTEIAPANNPTKVSVTGCVDGTHWLLYKYNGQLADNGPNGRRGTSAQIDRNGGAWKVSSLAIQGVGTCPG